MTSNDFLSPLHKERQVRGHQLLRKINGAARCRSSGEADQPTALHATLEEDGARSRHVSARVRLHDSQVEHQPEETNGGANRHRLDVNVS